MAGVLNYFILITVKEKPVESVLEVKRGAPKYSNRRGAGERAKRCEGRHEEEREGERGEQRSKEEEIKTLKRQGGG